MQKGLQPITPIVMEVNGDSMDTTMLKHGTIIMATTISQIKQ